MNRRAFLKFLASGAAGIAAYDTLDLDKLLWVKGERTIFIPSGNPSISVAQIVAIEMERILPTLRNLFERDDIFYVNIMKRGIEVSSTRQVRIPL